MAEFSPLFVLLTVMQRRWESEDWEGAVALAKVAAPYLHGKAPTARFLGDVSGVPDEELDQWSGAGGTAPETASTRELG